MGELIIICWKQKGNGSIRKGREEEGNLERKESKNRSGIEEGEKIIVFSFFPSFKKLLLRPMGLPRNPPKGGESFSFSHMLFVG